MTAPARRLARSSTATLSVAQVAPPVDSEFHERPSVVVTDFVLNLVLAVKTPDQRPPPQAWPRVDVRVKPDTLSRAANIIRKRASVE